MSARTLDATVVGVTAEDVDSAIRPAVQNAIMHDVNMLGVDESDAVYQRAALMALRVGSDNSRGGFDKDEPVRRSVRPGWARPAPF